MDGNFEKDDWECGSGQLCGSAGAGHQDRESEDLSKAFPLSVSQVDHLGLECPKRLSFPANSQIPWTLLLIQSL